MALSLKKVCNYPSCNVSTRKKYCEDHVGLDKQRCDADRPSAHQRGYDKEWRNIRKLWLQDYPLCVRCGQGATEVDHIIPHRGDRALFLDTSNLQSLCKSCHSAKTRLEVNDRTQVCG